MSTTVAYHAEHNGTAHPAVNVKVHAVGLTFWPAEFSWLTEQADAAPGGRYDAASLGDLVTAAYDRVQSDFWQAAEQIATERGLGEIAQEGRSGGWLVFTDGRDPQNIYDEPWRTDWLAAYRAMAEWAADWIADAPRRVRDLAQSLAMDEAGEGAARRMFATVR